MSIKVETSPGGVRFIRSSKKGKVDSSSLPPHRKRRAWISGPSSQQKTNLKKTAGS